MEESQVVAGWMARGEERGRRKDLLRVLELRFAVPLPADLIRTIQSETDVARLSRWLDEAVRSETLEKFQAALAGAS